ncbi:MAG: hypothetical protein ACI94Y_002152 [Maribacter sp.]|jgi:hypothetical protein
MNKNIKQNAYLNIQVGILVYNLKIKHQVKLK